MAALGTISPMDGAPATETDLPDAPATSLTEIEAWFVRRGVPQLVADYTTERRMDARALPFLGIWLVAGSFLWWGTRPGAPIGLNLLGGLAVLAVLAVGLAGIRRILGQEMWWSDPQPRTLETFCVGPLVGLSSGLIERSWLVGLQDGLNALVGIGVIYLVVGLGLGEIAWWSLKRLKDELAQITGLLARTLPILLILVLFLLFAAELWEAAHLLAAAELLAVVALLVLVAAIVVLNTFRRELRAFYASPVEQLPALAASTPAAPLAGTARLPEMPEMETLPRLNLAVLVLVGQLIQSAFVAIVIGGFLVVFGIIALPVALQEGWIGGPARVLATFELLGETRTISAELLTTSTLLGGVVGLYFTGLAVTDSAYRKTHFDRLVDEVRQLLAAHAFYITARNGSAALGSARHSGVPPERRQAESHRSGHRRA